MSSPLGTTCLVLAWCLVLSLGWSNLCFAVVAYRRLPAECRQTAATTLGTGMIMPALVAAPLTLLAAFRSLQVNLLFPVTLFADVWELVGASLAPALVLFCASGLASTLAREISREYRHWQHQPFSMLSSSLGKSTPRDLYKLVMGRSLGQAWAQVLPWLFGELVVVEAIFNAPGLGLEAWHLARIRDHTGLIQCIGWLAGLYLICILFTSWSNKRLGQRLASYG